MILVDTSVWVDHFRTGDPKLAVLLNVGQVLVHPFVLGEIALGHLQPRAAILNDLAALPKAVAAQESEVLAFIETQKLFGLGVGYVDAHLMASVRLMAGTALWTRDKRLLSAARATALPLH
jgi:predicted nucleic acid-binding protein